MKFIQLTRVDGTTSFVNVAAVTEMNVLPSGRVRLKLTGDATFVEVKETYHKILDAMIADGGRVLEP